MKDFAAPNILMVEADRDAKENTRYMYDTCLGQNLQDYTYNICYVTVKHWFVRFDAWED